MEEEKKQLKALGKTQLQLANETGIKWRRLTGGLGGYWELSIDEQSKIRRAIKKWKEERAVDAI